MIHLRTAPPPPEGLEVLSVVAGRDLLIQPVISACCPFGESVHFEDFGHVELLFRPEVFAEIAAALRPRERQVLSAHVAEATRSS